MNNQTSLVPNTNSYAPVVVNNADSAAAQRYATTEAQLEVWLSSQQSVEANCAYNEISSLVFQGPLDVARLRKAIDHVVARHGALRSTVSRDGREIVVHGAANYDWTQHDFSRGTDNGIEDALTSVVHRQATTPFDLINGPLVRFVLQTVSDTHHKLTVAAHHLILDGWSLAVFCQDLGHFYDKLSGNQTDELPPANDYRHYAAKMNEYLASEAGKKDEAFWVKQFADAIPVLDLPTENTRPALRTYEGRRFDHVINAELAESVRKMGAKAGCSLFNTMLAAFSSYLARISGTDDFCVGIPTAGQAAQDQPELIGHCVNTMPVRTKIDVNDSFGNYLKKCRNSLLDAFDHQRYSYGSLLRKLAPPRDPARPPMLSVSFNLDPMIDAGSLGFAGLEVEVVIEPRSFENFEWFVNGVLRDDKSIELQVQYNSNLYSSQSMRFYLEGFEAFLSEIAAAPHSRISQLNTMSVAQRKQVIVDWNQTELDYPTDSTLPGEFARQAVETPTKTAVTFGDRSLTYEQVETQSNQIARYLQTQGVNAGDLVGICVNRSERMLVYVYAIMKAGAGYVPLDPAYPADRLQYMCEHSGLKLVVTESELTEQVGQFDKPQIVIDEVTAEIERLDRTAVESAVTPSDIGYVIYTSGSTGKPKGVQVPHGAIVNFLYAMRETPGFDENDSVLAVTTLSFDIAVLELYLPTIFGGHVVIVDGATAVNGVELAKQLDKHDISLLQATPATWRLLIQSGWEGKSDLKVLCGGEPMPTDLVAPLLDRCAELWNMYGPTETTVWSAAFQIKSPTAPILIGEPVGNTQIYLLDANGNEVPTGCEGEVYIGGAGVTLGYRNRDDLTAERFVDNRYRNPFVEYVSDTLYKTGDLARYRFDGNIEFLRRNDKQVKVRGFRIELGEIEQNIKSHSAVAQAVAIVREDKPGDIRLVAYVVVNDDASVGSSELRDHLRQSVPYYMVPQHFVMLDAMPQTNNGKIDYKALPAPSVEVAETNSDEQALPQTAAEKYLAGVWQDVLELDDIGLDDLFFDIGGHSLLVMQVISTVSEKTGLQLGPQDFLVGTLEQMADKISASYVFKDDIEEEAAATERDSHVKVEAKQDIEPETEPAIEPQKSSVKVFKKLTGFWS